VETYHPKIFRVVRGILGDWHRSEDVCQDVFLVLYRKLPGFRGQSALSTWVYRIAINAALKARRRDRLRDVGRLALGWKSTKGEAPPEFSFEGDEVVEKLLRPLPEHWRSAVVLKECLDLSYAELAEVLGCTLGAVEQRIHRAMLSLRDIWKKTSWKD
jgi:RNA polymerase sigma-70 factor (ECF subfamily)